MCILLNLLPYINKVSIRLFLHTISRDIFSFWFLPWLYNLNNVTFAIAKNLNISATRWDIDKRKVPSLSHTFARIFKWDKNWFHFIGTLNNWGFITFQKVDCIGALWVSPNFKNHNVDWGQLQLYNTLEGTPLPGLATGLLLAERKNAAVYWHKIWQCWV